MECCDICSDFEYTAYAHTLDYLKSICEWSECSHDNHCDLRTVWENNHNRTMINKCGVKIYLRSGSNGRSACYHVFLHVMRSYLKGNERLCMETLYINKSLVNKKFW